MIIIDSVNDYMRASKESLTGGTGVSEVAGLFERIKWAPVENRDRHDLGTDLLVAARDPRRYDRGLLVGVQVKTGRSYFEEPVTGSDGELRGWFFREDHHRHFDYWVKHQLPHLVVLYNLDARVGYWVHVTPQRCEPTGKGVRIIVPNNQTISERDLPRLLEVALAQRGSISLEGTAFDAAALHIAPGDRLRFALLVPRLVAPHANRGKIDEMSPEEALALLMLLHVSTLQNQMKDHLIWPKLNEEPNSSDWRWRFVYAFWRYLTANDLVLLEEAYSQAAREDWRVGAVIVLAATYYLTGRTEAAASLIASELARDAGAPVDHAWLHLHAARYAVELGDAAKGKDHAEEAIRNLAGDANDATASMLSGVGYKILLGLSGWQHTSEDVSTTLKAGDNAGSWWRDQQLRWALDAVALDRFRAWAEDKASRWDAEPPAQQLLPSLYTSLFAADHAGWVASECRLGQFETQTARVSSEFEAGFVRLLKSGDSSSIVLAGRRAWNWGPAATLAALSSQCVPSLMTRSRVDSTLTFWEEFGSIGKRSAADAVVSWCLEQAEPITAGGSRMLGEFSNAKLMETLVGAIPAASRSSRNDIAKRLPTFSVDWTELNSYGRLAKALQKHCGSSNIDCDALISVARSNPSRHEAATLLGVAARAGSDSARAELRSAVLGGNLRAAAIAYNEKFLNEEEARAPAEKLLQVLAAERQQASNRSYGMGHDIDRAGLLVALFFRFPLIAEWQSVIDYIGDPAVLANHKEDACIWISENALSLPPSARNALQDQLAGLRNSRYLAQNMFDLSAPRESAIELADYVSWSLSDSADGLEEYVGRAFATSARAKKWALDVLCVRAEPGFDLLALQALADNHLEVRVRAAQFVAHRIAKKADTTVLRRSAEKILDDPSVLLPNAFLAVLTRDCPSWLLERVNSLLIHFAAPIRNLARNMLAGAATPQFED